MAVSKELHVSYEYSNGSSDNFIVKTENVEEAKLQHLGCLRLNEIEWLTFTNQEGIEIHVRTSAIVRATAFVNEIDSEDI